MKAISQRQHKALIIALRQLEELQRTDLPAMDVPCPTGSFLYYIQSLSEQFSDYEARLGQLADCIAEYEALYKEVRVNVLAPALRQVKRKEAHITQYNRDQYQLVVAYAKEASRR